MGGTDVDEARASRYRVDDEPLVVDGHRVDDGPVGLEEAVCGLVAGVLDRDDRAGVDQDPGDEIERLLRPRHNHVVTRGDDRPGEGGIPRDLGL